MAATAEHPSVRLVLAGLKGAEQGIFAPYRPPLDSFCATAKRLDERSIKKSVSSAYRETKVMPLDCFL